MAFLWKENLFPSPPPKKNLVFGIFTTEKVNDGQTWHFFGHNSYAKIGPWIARQIFIRPWMYIDHLHCVITLVAHHRWSTTKIVGAFEQHPVESRSRDGRRLMRWMMNIVLQNFKQVLLSQKKKKKSNFNARVYRKCAGFNTSLNWFMLYSG